MGVRLYVKPGCPLCDKVRDWLEDLGVQPEEVNILSDETLYRDFKDIIPVVAVEGQLLPMPFTRRGLRAWLARTLAGGTPPSLTFARRRRKAVEPPTGRNHSP